jgi:hypothetical protein
MFIALAVARAEAALAVARAEAKAQVCFAEVHLHIRHTALRPVHVTFFVGNASQAGPSHARIESAQPQPQVRATSLRASAMNGIWSDQAMGALQVAQCMSLVEFH